MGMGANTILTQMACEALGCPMESMTVVESDTDIVPLIRVHTHRARPM